MSQKAKTLRLPAFELYLAATGLMALAAVVALVLCL